MKIELSPQAPTADKTPGVYRDSDGDLWLITGPEDTACVCLRTTGPCDVDGETAERSLSRASVQNNLHLSLEDRRRLVYVGATITLRF